MECGAKLESGKKKKKKKRRREEKGDLVIIAGSKSGQNISESSLLIACLPPQNFPHWCHNKKSAFDHIINPSLIELVQSRWLDIGTRGVLLISSGGVDQMIFLGLNFQFRDFFE